YSTFSFHWPPGSRVSSNTIPLLNPPRVFRSPIRLYRTDSPTCPGSRPPEDLFRPWCHPETCIVRSPPTDQLRQGLTRRLYRRDVGQECRLSLWYRTGFPMSPKLPHPAAGSRRHSQPVSKIH